MTTGKLSYQAKKYIPFSVFRRRQIFGGVPWAERLCFQGLPPPALNGGAFGREQKHRSRQSYESTVIFRAARLKVGSLSGLNVGGRASWSKRVIKKETLLYAAVEK